MVLAPSILPATVSIRWPHSSAVTLGAAGAVGTSAARLTPTDRSSANPALSSRGAVVRFNKEESRIFIFVQAVLRFGGAALQHRMAHRSIRNALNVFRYRH